MRLNIDKKNFGEIKKIEHSFRCDTFYIEWNDRTERWFERLFDKEKHEIIIIDTNYIFVYNGIIIGGGEDGKNSSVSINRVSDLIEIPIGMLN